MGGILNIGTKSLLANQYALMLTSQNISNVNTKGYARRVVEFTENGGFNGVSIGDVRRIVNETVNSSARGAMSVYSSAQTLSEQLARLEPLFEGNQSGVGSAITETLSSLQKLNTNPSQSVDRSLWLNSLKQLSIKMQSASSTISSEVNKTNKIIQENVSEINSLLQNIQGVNKKLSSLSSQSGSETFALQDERDVLLEKLSSHINISSTIDPATHIATVTMSNGLLLASDTQAKTFIAMPDPYNSSYIIPGLVTSGGNKSLDATLIQSGSLQGIINYRDKTLQSVARLLDQLSATFASALNTQNALGLDGKGRLGSNVYKDINSAECMASRFLPALSNVGIGTMSVNIDDPRALINSDYRLSIGNAGAYSLKRISDGVVVQSGTLTGSLPQTMSADGFSMSLTTGTFSSGDSYKISPAGGSAGNFLIALSDPSLLALAWPVSASAQSVSTQSTAKISVTGIMDTTTAAFSTAGVLNPPLQVRFLTPTSYEIVNSTSSSVIEGPVTYDPISENAVFPTPLGYDPGYRISISGTCTAGDTFAVDYNSNYAGDNRNGLEMTKLYTMALMPDGGTFSSGMESIVGFIATTASQSNSSLTAANEIKSATFKARETISGVNNEEESMNLMQYQEAYQASAQILQAARSVIQIILEIVRG